MVENGVSSGYSVQLQVTSIIFTKSQYINYIITEVNEIELHPNSMNLS
jgi:hypothetical protein